MKKVELINMLGEFRQLTRMIRRVDIIAHDNIDADEWDEKIDNLERETARLIKKENARKAKRGSIEKVE